MLNRTVVLAQSNYNFYLCIAKAKKLKQIA